ncbi:hypothetical protein BDZ85DRAFT_74157 [Elsinoe ampelina]|uniref:Zn(2)-C6 fungal-type domain-containing protein n=1 Tax=Elsinoe ampelina TaxID=302913 RepID=A0A6A6GK28_9PEZI|nr:hypothetical protein BDZ85DRAFT_74157 [Elsinoe ampelina]
MAEKRDASSVATEGENVRRRKYARRSVRACDECRLRKTRCDGEEPCKHCIDIGHAECSYEGRVRPPLPPTKRIRILEETLRATRGMLLAAREVGDHSLGRAQLDALLEKLDPTNIGDEDATQAGAPENTEQYAQVQSTSTQEHTSPSNHSDKSEGEGHASSNMFFGPISGHSLVYRISKTFQEMPLPDERTTRLHNAVTDLFCARNPQLKKHHEANRAIPLPDSPTLVALFSCTFSEHLLLFQILTESELVKLLDKFSEKRLSTSEKALLHGVATSGYARGRQRHAELGCQSSLEMAAQHFSAAQGLLNVARCEDVMSLQAVLCIVVYLISISDITSAHTFSAISCSWILQLGLHRLQPRSSPQGMLPPHRGKDLLIVTLKLHLYLTSILDLPLALQRKQVADEIWASVQSRYDSHLATELDRSSPSSCHFLLLEITKEGLDKTFSHSTEDMVISTDEAKEDIDLSQLGSVEARLQELIERCSASTAKISNQKMTAIAKAELEMTTYSCQLMLYMPFMHHAISMANNTAISRTRSQRVLTCIKTASKAISFAETYQKQSLLEPSSWFQTYTVFLSVLTLVFLIASHKGTTRPGEAWKKAEQGIRLLAAMRCHDNGANKSLRVLRALVDQLSHTVEFDIDMIEQTTPLLCGGTQGRGSSQLSSGGSGQSPGTGARDGRMSVSAVMQRNQSAADKMLAEANEFVLFGNAEGFGGA